jgi:hypothetical protein
LNKSALSRKERGGIDYGSRSNFFLLGSSLGGFGSRSSLGSRPAGFTAASRFATTTRIGNRFATASWLGATSGLAAALLALTATEDPIEQGDAATLLHDTLGRTSIAAILATTGGLNATTGITSFFTATSRIGAASVTAALLALVPTEQVQQRGLAALLGGATDVATLFATASRISLLATASRLGAASGICTGGVATTITSTLFALRAITEKVQQRRLAAFRLARHALHVAPGLTAAAGSRIRNRCVTAADFVAASIEIVSEHSVEQVATEALSAKA